MSHLSRKMVKWLLLFTVVSLLAACSSRPEPAPYPENIAVAKAPVTPSTKRFINSRAVALNVARQLIGTPYRYGGTDPNGFDCSGLVQYSFEKAGVQLPRTSRDIFRSSQLVSPDKRQPGDLVFFAISAGKVSHVGIYSGNNTFIHSPSSGKGVSYASLETPYWKKRLIGVGRI